MIHIHLFYKFGNGRIRIRNILFSLIKIQGIDMIDIEEEEERRRNFIRPQIDKCTNYNTSHIRYTI